MVASDFQWTIHVLVTSKIEDVEGEALQAEKSALVQAA